MAITISTNLFAQRSTDFEGSKDYALVSRFKGAIIEWYQHKDFDRYYILDLKGNKISNYEINGQVTRIQYSTGKDHSVFEIASSYENALKNSGFKILLKLDEKNCGVNLQEHVYNQEFNGLNALPRGAHKPDYHNNFCYLAAKKSVNSKDVYITVFITSWEFPLITFDAIEVQNMQQNLVTVKKLTESIDQNGHIAIYDIYFDSGKSEIKSESANALEQIAEYLKQQSDKQYLIVGHTDNTGNFEANLKLSLARANAVIEELTSKYGLNRTQLIPYGDGSTAPIASNTTDEGKAKNRRVEIVVK